MILLSLMVGGILGAMVRYCFTYVFEKQGRPFYVATLLVNFIGSFLIGCTIPLLVNEQLQAFFVTGFLGALTTFSTFAFDAVKLFKNKQSSTAILYVVMTLTLSFFGVVSGYAWANQ